MGALKPPVFYPLERSLMDKEKNYMNEEIDDSVGTMEDVNAVMKKYDRESNVRIYEGVPRILVRALMVGFAFYALVDAVFLTTLPERRYSIFLGLIVLVSAIIFFHPRRY